MMEHGIDSHTHSQRRRRERDRTEMDRPAPGRTGSRRSPGLRPEAGCRVRELCTAARATTRGGKRGAGVRTPLSCAAAKIAFRTGARYARTLSQFTSRNPRSVSDPVSTREKRYNGSDYQSLRSRRRASDTGHCALWSSVNRTANAHRHSNRNAACTTRKASRARGCCVLSGCRRRDKRR